MKIHEQRDLLHQSINDAHQELTDFLGYLGNDKFRGIDHRDNTAKNYIRTGEVEQFISRLRSHLTPDMS